jgi:hypothetical protein
MEKLTWFMGFCEGFVDIQHSSQPKATNPITCSLFSISTKRILVQPYQKFLGGSRFYVIAYHSSSSLPTVHVSSVTLQSPGFVVIDK